MPDYTKTVIYKIVCNNPEVKEIYVGSTCNFSKRKCDHKSTTHNSNSPKYELYLYRYIRYYGGWENWTMIPIRQYPCVDKMSKLIEERKHIERLGANLNCDIPTRTDAEWRVANKDYLKDYNKTYREENKESIAQRSAKWRLNNKDIIKEKRKHKIICECGCSITKKNIITHRRTKKHKVLLSIINKSKNNINNINNINKI